MPKRSRTPSPERASDVTGAPPAVGGAVVPPLPPAAVALHEGLVLVEVADPADLAAMLADPRFADLVLARVGERAVVVLPHFAPRLLLALAKAGHVATVEGEP